MLFDLGGVIMNIDRNHCITAFKRLGMENIDKFLGDYVQQGVFAQLEEGNISEEEFHRIIKRDCPEGTTDKEIDDAFNDFLLGIPRYRLEALLKLKERFRLCLLSNTNKIMWNSRIAEAFRQIPGKDIHSYFEGIVTSFEAHSLKPSPEIFHYAERHLGLVPERTLFLDDSESNVMAARKLGYYSEVVPQDDGDVFMIIERFIAAHGE